MKDLDANLEKLRAMLDEHFGIKAVLGKRYEGISGTTIHLLSPKGKALLDVDVCWDEGGTIDVSRLRVRITESMDHTDDLNLTLRVALRDGTLGDGFARGPLAIKR